jgi:hypothetical protein
MTDDVKMLRSCLKSEILTVEMFMPQVIQIKFIIPYHNVVSEKI